VINFLLCVFLFVKTDFSEKLIFHIIIKIIWKFVPFNYKLNNLINYIKLIQSAYRKLQSVCKGLMLLKHLYKPTAELLICGHLNTHHPLESSRK